MSRIVPKTAVVLLLPILLAACGVRGSLEAPKAAKEQGAATSPDAADNGPKSSAPQKPHRDFLLDPLLR